jgi:tRNA threonylcarbamoyladenosine biosynthesis protein TsaE
MTARVPLRKRLRSDDAERTRAIGAALARAAQPGDLVCLWGDLGAGKTELAKGFARGLGVSSTVTSPSFILIAEYEARLPLFHVDLYRLADAADVFHGGLMDDRRTSGVTLLEWPDRLGRALPAVRLDVRISGSGEDRRSIEVEAADPSLERYLEVVP